MSQQGRQDEQLATLQDRFTMLRRDIDLLQSRPGLSSQSVPVRLARIEGTPAGGDNTYSISFLEGTFAETAGNQTPTYTDRQATPSGFAHNVINNPTTPPANGDICIVWRWSQRWWFQWE